MTRYIPDRVEYTARRKEIGLVCHAVVGGNFSAMTCVQLAVWVDERKKNRGRGAGAGAGLI